MKFFKNILAALSLIVLATVLTTCTNPFASNEEEKTTFTISIGTNNVKAVNNSRAVAYPPNIEGSNPGHPELKDLKFIVTFTPLTGGTVETFTGTGNKEFTGTVKAGHYKVTMDVLTVADNQIYARGVADDNPIEIKAKDNKIHVEAYSADSAYPPVIKAKPQGAVYHKGETPKDLTVVAETPEDGGPLEYQWYSNGATNSNSGGTAISGATSASYTPSTATEGNFHYYVKITNKHGTPTSILTMPVHVYVGDNAEPPEIKTQPEGPTGGIAKNSTSFELTVTAEVAKGTLTYQWYSNAANNNTSGTAISGATSASYKPPTTTAGTTYYYVVITNTDNTAPGQTTATIKSDPVAVTVNPSVDAAAPTIAPAGQPAVTTTISVGGTATLTVSANASDGGALTYHWYSNTTASNTGGQAISGATSASYTTPNNLAAGDHYYYCVITNTIANNGDGGTKTATATSNVATVTVSTAPVAPTWTVVSDSKLTGDITGIAYGDGKFVAVDNNGEIAWSNDGKTWTTAESVLGFGTLSDIAWGKDKFVTGGVNGKMMWSMNGTAWEAVADSTFTTNLTISAFAWGSNGSTVNKFVAGGYNLQGYTDSKMAYSEDGISWTAVADNTFGTSGIQTIAWGNGKFVAGGNDGKMAWSEDGISWTAVANSTFGTSWIWGIAYEEGMFVAGGNDGKMAWSEDGKNWTAVGDSTFGTDQIFAIAYGNGKFVAGGKYGKMAWSEDGKNWTAVGAVWGDGTFSYDILTIGWGNGKFVAGSRGGKMAWSDN